MRETQVQSLGWEDPLEKEMATHSSILAWRIPWREEPGGLQSMGSQRVGHDMRIKKPTKVNNSKQTNPILLIGYQRLGRLLGRKNIKDLIRAARKNTGQSDKCEFQLNTIFFFKHRYIPSIALVILMLNKLFIVYLKFKCNWVPGILIYKIWQAGHD